MAEKSGSYEVKNGQTVLVHRTVEQGESVSIETPKKTPTPTKPDPIQSKQDKKGDK